MVFPDTVLYPANQNRGGHHEAHRQDIMVDGRVQKSLFLLPNEWLRRPAHRAGQTVGVSKGKACTHTQNCSLCKKLDMLTLGN